ncbi:hypothetical protein M2323_002381 [Rhodoblastus acidophilus]|uniref:hypothetical protein n=1 Tax=Rhodoblastus acidophilus TaxID=1074 RepID=UPI002224B4A9|nr:hypothetical protein [Rhodoblastus acidophilus]MCW2286361.1 hypothetical protein [Rhodoblastus acidophilus]MCW2333447.1 hypothetical protein [Rhodoblastus acidophilus]
MIRTFVLLVLLFALANSGSHAQSDDRSGARVVIDTSASAPGAPTLTTDVFWCTGDDQAQNRAQTASELAAAYAVLARIGPAAKMLKSIVIRTRSIDKENIVRRLDAQALPLANTKIVLTYDAKDPLSKIFVESVHSPWLAVTAAVTIKPHEGEAFTPNYISAFVCTDMDTSRIAGRLFFQVEKKEQIDAISRAGADLRKALPGLNVVSQVEVVGDKAPKTSELRYFFQADEKLAIRAAASITASTSGDITPKLVPGYGGKVRPGTLEAWISN